MLWIISGKPVETFDPSQVKVVQPPRQPKPSSQEPSDDDSGEIIYTASAKRGIFMIVIVELIALGGLGWLVWKLVVWVYHLL